MIAGGCLPHITSSPLGCTPCLVPISQMHQPNDSVCLCLGAGPRPCGYHSERAMPFTPPPRTGGQCLPDPNPKRETALASSSDRILPSAGVRSHHPRPSPPTTSLLTVAEEERGENPLGERKPAAAWHRAATSSAQPRTTRLNPGAGTQGGGRGLRGQEASDRE